MSINSSLGQIAGGAAAMFGGMVVIQQDNFSPLEHYDTLGYIIVILSIIGIFLVYRVSREIAETTERPIAMTEEPVLAE